MLGAAPQGASVKQKMTLPDGSTVEHAHDPPPPPDPAMPAPPADDAEDSTITLTPTAWMSIVSVNEARESIGLEKLPGHDGDMTCAAYQAKYAAPVAIASNAALGKVGMTPANPPPAPAGPPGAGGPPKPGGGVPPGAGPPKAPPGPPAPRPSGDPPKLPPFPGKK
jgi:hypothetical protein